MHGFGRIDAEHFGELQDAVPASEPTPSIALHFDGWVLPKAGVAFVWVLDREMAATGA